MNTRYYLRLLRTLALAALTAAATAACSDDNDDDNGNEPLTPPDGISVAFTADINPGSDADPAGAPDTRTVLHPTTGGGFNVTWKGKDQGRGYDEICIWAAKENNLENNGDGKYYVPSISAASSALEPYDEYNTLTLSSEGDWTFTAIYGYDTDAFNSSAKANISSQSQSAPNKTEHIAARDFSVATATQYVAADNEMPRSINLGFKHMLSALQLRVTNQTGEELTVQEIRLSAAGGEISTQKTYDVAQGKWNTTGEEKAAYLQLTADNFPALATGGASQDLHMLLFPEPGHSRTNMTVTVITSRGEYSRTKPAPDGGFLAAKNYLTNIVIKTDGLTAEEKWVETISSKAELIAFRDKVNNGNTYDGKTVRLTADIDLANETWTTPIGNGSNDFRGTFDGGGYHISKLSVDYGNSYAGLFGYVYKGTVRNLRVSGTVKTTRPNVGGIAGTLDGSTVENCIFDGDVSGNSSVGGIAGNSLNNSRIAGCHTKGKVTATTSQNAGGIAGWNSSSTIDGCYSEAEVTIGDGNAGGIAGSNESGGTITHCYATGKVSGKGSVGGIVGYQYSGCTVTGCIALNPGLTRTEGYTTSFGRIVGDNQGGGAVNSCGAYDGMTITDNASQPITGTGEAGTALTRGQCLTYLAYTSRGFTEATATTPGWVLDNGAPWQYLPWNTVFEDFPGISVTDYRISVPAHLSGGGTN